MKERIGLLVLLFLLLAAVCGIFLLVAQKAELQITGVTPVWAEMNPDVQKEIPIAILNRGDVMQIASCIDTKSDFVYQIELPDGKIGYVSPGEYQLSVYPIWKTAGPIVSNCH